MAQKTQEDVGEANQLEIQLGSSRQSSNSFRNYTQ
jgi:hypothetical protein